MSRTSHTHPQGVYLRDIPGPLLCQGLTCETTASGLIKMIIAENQYFRSWRCSCGRRLYSVKILLIAYSILIPVECACDPPPPPPPPPPPSLPFLQRVYYLSMEYYMGRSLTNAMVNLGIDSEVEEALFEVRDSSTN